MDLTNIFNSKLKDIAGARPKCLVDHMTSFKTTAESYPKLFVPVIQLLATVARTGVDKSRDTLEYICDVVMGIDSEKHNLIFKEISLILQKFPSLLNSNLINRLNKFEVRSRFFWLAVQVKISETKYLSFCKSLGKVLLCVRIRTRNSQ